MTAVVKTNGPIPDGKLNVGAAKEVHDMNWKQAAANLAKANSSSQEVKDFADQMITDHQSADELTGSHRKKVVAEVPGGSGPERCPDRDVDSCTEE